ncbi:MAG: hypothetical protein ACRDKW_17140, partial [Actinomycetota bacterium]
MVAAVASLVVRWRHASGGTRAQIELLALGHGRGDHRELLLGWFWVGAAVAAALPLAAGAAILRYGLYDVDLALNRSLVYATLTVLLAGAY